jgi:hypothetical protein
VNLRLFKNSKFDILVVRLPLDGNDYDFTLLHLYFQAIPAHDHVSLVEFQPAILP